LGDMSNYVGQREQFISNRGPQNEVKNVTKASNIKKTSFI